MYEDSLKEEQVISDEEESEEEESEVVRTVTKDEAVTATGTTDSVVVANVDGKYVRFAKLEHVPAGCRTYSSKNELKPQTKKQIESIYSMVKSGPKTFKDQEEAMQNLWSAFGEMKIAEPKIPTPLPSSETRDKKYLKKKEEDVYEMKPPTERSTKMLSTMAPQARTCVEILRSAGKPRYEEQELRDLLESNKDKFRTKQTSWRVFQYYRPALIAAGILIQK